MVLLLSLFYYSSVAWLSVLTSVKFQTWRQVLVWRPEAPPGRLGEFFFINNGDQQWDFNGDLMGFWDFNGDFSGVWMDFGILMGF